MESIELSDLFSDKLLTLLRQVQRVAVLTGAGISAESGVPTFRGENGIWRKMNPHELASMSAFMRNPGLVWEWYSYRKSVVNEVQPNAGHRALVTLEQRFNNFTLITQNVDDLHRRAGSINILELHGNITKSYCLDCKKYYSEVPVSEPQQAPRCDCGGLIRPDVVWFGEMLPSREIKLAFDAARQSELFFSIGTTAEVQPAGSLPIEALQNGAYVVEINPDPTVISDQVHECVRGKAGIVLPQLVSAMQRNA